MEQASEELDKGSIKKIITNTIPLKDHYMPEICRFYGILIKMLFEDHNPPHFHVIYNEFKAAITINDLRIIKGDLPPKAFGLVMEWAKIHQNELIKEWDLAKDKQNLFKIEPLK